MQKTVRLQERSSLLENNLIEGDNKNYNEMNGIQEPLVTEDAEKAEAEVINYNGSWENNKRNILAAAITGLVGIGAVYFNVQSVLAVIAIFVYSAFLNIHPEGGIFDNMESTTSIYKAPLLVALTITQYLFMLFPALYIIRKWHTTDVKKYIRVKLVPVKEVLLAVIITISVLPLCYFLSTLLLDLLGIPESYREVGENLFSAANITEFIIMIFVVAVTPAICEEVFFRGYFQRTLERKTGFKSFIWTGVLFGLYHLQPLGLITLSILGLLFSFLYYRSKSIFPSSAAHFTNNFVVLVFLFFPVGDVIDPGKVPLWLVGVSTIISAGLITLYYYITQDAASERV